MTRDKDPAAHDLAVIGGGVNGCGVARDAAGRGARVLLLERGDLAQGTSSASTKLIHGGLRYLEHREFGLVRESLAERERLWAIAPHIVHPLRFVLPWVPGLRPRWMLRLGLFLYDHIGGRRALPPTESIDLRRHPAGRPLKTGFGTAFVYSDGWVDDARLVILNARDAADRGTEVHSRTEVRRLERESGGWTIYARAADGTMPRFRARAVVNAAGPLALDLLHRAHGETDRHMRLVRGSHIVVPRLFDHGFAYFFQLPDGRIFFALPYERDFTLIGTTDRDHRGPVDDVRPDPDEIAYLCEGANRYFRKSIAPQDVLWSYAGVRPLVDDGSGRPEAATRGYRLELDAPDGEAPLLSLFGGKITTYRHLAAEAVAMLKPFLPSLSGGDWTAKAALPGGDFPMQGRDRLIADLGCDYPFLDYASAERIACAYGTRAWEWLDGARDMAALGAHFGHGLTEAELRYLVAREWAMTADDILWRRTKLGLRLDARQTAHVREWLGEKA
ncbi:glycerol-3-phosphate dehydrogenase [Sphingobium sp. 22B]|uniref:glycerol-3-phosphate dehydrogenase n=1 Tax=unclassified Sphingobium TaxID=2611147 RepID=UPI00078043A9|nr:MULTISPECIES: glycerol-3-phosphate dehydrogenase [unclassified Sphingobium]KXU29664.1 glycerol-3-phosphate dehydrogenase [Sphingobium sp. AM]KYC30792.1 glycerol-3-phosphate dehydrogenase [Sphingobium sp. 22B]OAP29579.1 glycerol-3-phosphate dehydrogenase [Sphingobium sp. 20006FA]